MRMETFRLSVLAIAPFSPALDTDTPPVFTVDSQSLDTAMAELAPTLDIPVDKRLCPDGSVTVTLRRMADFRPANLVGCAPFLKELLAARDAVKAGGAPGGLAAAFPRVAGLVSPTAPGPAAGPAAGRSAGADALDDILSMVETGGGDSGAHSGNDVQAQIDALIGGLLQAILADPNFRRMEAAWRGAALVLRQAPASGKGMVSLTLVPLPSRDCLPVFDRLETLMAAAPPDLALLDAPLANTPRDMTVLERVMDFAQAMLAPAAVAMGPKFLGIPDWDAFKPVRFIPGLLEGAEYGRWKTLAGRPGAGWLVPCVGGVMARPLHRPESGFAASAFSEAGPLWISAPWALAALCAGSMAVHGRPTRFADRATVRLDAMPLADGPVPSPLELHLDTGRLAEFKQAGILPLAGTPGRDHVFVAGAVTMDGGPLPFRLFLSLLTGFLIRTAMTRHDEIRDIESDLARAISRFMESLGLAAPDDLEIVAREEHDGMTPLAISLTPDPEILPGGNRFTFGFGW